MAREIQEIQQEIIDAKEADSELNDLTSNSSTAIWRLWTYITAYIIHLFEKLQDTFKLEIQAIIDSRRIGTLAWYVSSAKDFQLGDSLVEFSVGDYGYSIIDETKRIITRASAKVDTGVITLKVAKDGGAGAEALTAQELLQFQSYMEQIKFAGVEINYVSLDADQLNVELDIWYDGIYATTDIQDDVQAAIEAYIDSLGFDGTIKLNALIEAVRDVIGVTDVNFTLIEAVQGVTTTPITREYETIAGYINLNDFTINNFNVDPT